MPGVRGIQEEVCVLPGSGQVRAVSSRSFLLLLGVVFTIASRASAETITDSIPGARGAGAAQTPFATQTDDPPELRFLGVVDSAQPSGVTIRDGLAVDTQFDLSDDAKRPKVNAVSGRNVQGGDYKFNGDTAANTWEYFVSAEPGEYLVDIDFSGELWYAEGVNGNEIIHFQLFTNDMMVSSAVLDAGDERSSGDGQQEMDGMSGLLTDAGGPNISSAAVRIFLDGDGAFESGSESFWMFGTLTAESVPEPTSWGLLIPAFLGIAAWQRNLRR